MIALSSMKNSYARFAFFLLLYTILVIIWGAWVRISHSGDGCGDTWPLCQGRLIPEAERAKTWIEYAHRLMSGLYGWVVLFFYWKVRKNFPKGSALRRATGWVVIFMISEALLGAKLVLFKLVGSNDTPYRAFVMALHQVNSMLLTGATTLAFLNANAEAGVDVGKKFVEKKTVALAALFLLITVFGAFAALSGTLFPSASLMEGFWADVADNSHYLVKLRGLHPLLAILIGGSMMGFYWWKAQSSADEQVQKAAGQAALAMLIGIAFGISTLLALSPVWMKLTHLALAHTMWFFLLRYLWTAKTRAIQ